MKPKAMTWGGLLVVAKLGKDVLPEEVSLKDQVTQSDPEAFELVSIYREIEAIETSIKNNYPDRCLSCNAQGGEWRSYEEWGGQITDYYSSCSDCVEEGLDPCNTSLKLLLSDALREQGYTSIEEVARHDLESALSPTTGDYAFRGILERDKLSRLRARASRIEINMICPEEIPF